MKINSGAARQILIGDTDSHYGAPAANHFDGLPTTQPSGRKATLSTRESGKRIIQGSCPDSLSSGNSNPKS